VAGADLAVHKENVLGGDACSAARQVLGWPRRRKLAHAVPWEHIYKRRKLAQLLGQQVVLK
jgi:hypothetical protein